MCVLTYCPMCTRTGPAGGGKTELYNRSVRHYNLLISLLLRWEMRAPLCILVSF